MRGQAWSGEQLVLLRRLWGEGKTAAAIADRLGFSRSAVLGKVFRLRLAPQPDCTASAKMPKRRRARQKTPPAPAPAPAARRGLSLMELSNATCRWPHGKPGTDSFHFCGAPGADLENGMPYCAEHARRAYLVPPRPSHTAPRWMPRRAPPTAIKVRVTTNPKWWRA